MLSVTPFSLAIALGLTAATPQAVAVPQSAPVAASLADAPLEAGEGRRVAQLVAVALVRDFVVPQNARDYADTLRKNAAAGRYDAGTRGALARLMTADLLAVHKDGHLHISVSEPDEPGGARRGPPPGFKVIQSAKWIAPGIAYIRPSAFLSTDEEVTEFRQFMADHRDAKTMIFDMRNHHGGRLGEMDVIFPYLFAAKTPLVKMELARSAYEEKGSPFGESPTLEFEKGSAKVTATHYAIPGDATPLRTAKVMLLTSNATASAGEHFSLAMESTGRATLIGEATAGANHFGGPSPVGDHFTVWMPIGRTYDVKTGQDWEGAGVQPDIAVDPKLALIVALEKAGLSHDEAVRLDATELPAEPVHRDKLRAR